MNMMNFYSYVSLPEGSEGKYSNTPHKKVLNLGKIRINTLRRVMNHE